MWGPKGIFQIGVLFSKRALATEEGVACLQWKASVQWENIETMTKTYFIYDMV